MRKLVLYHCRNWSPSHSSSCLVAIQKYLVAQTTKIFHLSRLKSFIVSINLFCVCFLATTISRADINSFKTLIQFSQIHDFPGKILFLPPRLAQSVMLIIIRSPVAGFIKFMWRNHLHMSQIFSQSINPRIGFEYFTKNGQILKNGKLISAQGRD